MKQNRIAGIHILFMNFETFYVVTIQEFVNFWVGIWAFGKLSVDPWPKDFCDIFGELFDSFSSSPGGVKFAKMIEKWKCQFYRIFGLYYSKYINQHSTTSTFIIIAKIALFSIFLLRPPEKSLYLE